LDSEVKSDFNTTTANNAFLSLNIANLLFFLFSLYSLTFSFEIHFRKEIPLLLKAQRLKRSKWKIKMKL